MVSSDRSSSFYPGDVVIHYDYATLYLLITQILTRFNFKSYSYGIPVNKEMVLLLENKLLVRDLDSECPSRINTV